MNLLMIAAVPKFKNQQVVAEGTMGVGVKMVDKEMGAEALHNPTRPSCDSSHVKSPTLILLRLRTLRMTAGFDLNLNLIAQ